MGALVGIGSLVLTLAIACDERANKAPIGNSPQSVPPAHQEINGNCNAQGTDIQINCAPAPISRAALTIDYPYLTDALFAGRPDEIPPPPAIPITSARSHCEEWREWMDGNPRMYRPLALMAGISSGQQDVVAIRRAYVKIFKRTPMGSTVSIGCARGGDGVFEGYTLTIDTVRSTTTVEKGDSDGVHPMPPASVSLGGAGFTSVDIFGRSQPGFLYEGQLVLEVLVNGEEKSVVKGTTEEPFRWYEEPVNQAPGFYDWHFESKKLAYFADEFQYLDQLPE